MASVSGNGSRGHHRFTLNVNETGTSTANNTSTVSWSLVLSPIQSGWDWNISGISYSVNVDGNVKNGTIPSYNGSSTVTIASGTKTITHNNDGSKSINFGFSVTDGANKSYTPGNASGSGSLTLTKINRIATTTSATNFNDETNPTIQFSNPAGYNLQPYLNFYLNGSLAKTIYRNKGQYSSPYTWNLTNEEREELRELLTNINSCTVNEGVDTYSGNTKLGFSSISKTFSIINANPVFEDFDFKDINPTTTTLTGDNQIFIKNQSTLEIDIDSEDKMETQKYATGNKYLYVVGDTTGSVNYSDEDLEITAGTLNLSGDQLLSVRAYDSRNNSTEVIKNIKILDYESPTLTATLHRQNDFETPTTLEINGSFTSLLIENIEKNTVQSVQYRYKEIEGDFTQWQNAVVSISGTSFTCNNIVINLDSTKTFDFEIKVTDALSTTTITKRVNSGEAIFFISTNLKKCFVNGDKILTENEFNNVYDTTEHLTGEIWTDGKPIYRKVVEFGAITNTTYDNNIPSGITNMDTCVDLSGTFHLNNLEIPVNFHNSVTAGGAYSFCCYYNKTSNNIVVLCKTAINSGHVVVKYTKTTD